MGRGQLIARQPLLKVVTYIIPDKYRNSKNILNLYKLSCKLLRKQL